MSEDPAQLLQCSQVYSSRRRRRRRMSSSSSGARQAAPCPGERSQSCWGAGEVRTPDPRVCSVRGAAEQDTGRGMHARRQGSLPCAEETIAKRTDETQMKSDRVSICRVSLTKSTANQILPTTPKKMKRGHHSAMEFRTVSVPVLTRTDLRCKTMDCDVPTREKKRDGFRRQFGTYQHNVFFQVTCNFENYNAKRKFQTGTCFAHRYSITSSARESYNTCGNAASNSS